MTGFKLLAIHVLDKCFREVRKLLPNGQLYQFYSGYEFKFKNRFEVLSVVKVDEEEVRLYDFKKPNGEIISIDMSAIVGKNGSGKSTILELFYAFCLCISKDQPDIKIELEKLKNAGSSKWDWIGYLFNQLRVEVFYEVDGVINSIKYTGSDETQSYYFKPNRNAKDAFKLESFCYSIALNYSLYGLNEVNSPWLTPMFHKNDGYQSPLVINPFREDGQIDVNKEYHLANSRVLQNISFYDKADPEIINGQKLAKVIFSFEPKSLDVIYYDGKEYDLNTLISDFEEKTRTTAWEFFNGLSSRLVRQALSPGQITLFNRLKNLDTEQNIRDFTHEKNLKHRPVYIEYWFVRYVLKKAFKICLQYSWLRIKYIELTESNGKRVISFKEGKMNSLIIDLLEDKSHITLKLRQTIVMWGRRYFFEKVNWGTIRNQNNSNYFECSCEVSSLQISSAIGGIDYSKSRKRRFDLERIPGGILKPKILVTRDKDPASEAKIEALSSGEQQFLFTIQTIVYHLKNLDSVFDSSSKNKNRIKGYRNVLIILDEVELYFHPEFQRILIKDLIVQIKQINLKTIGKISFLFSTHSPFILSDIPSANIMKVKSGQTEPYEYGERTFGANIHDLLAKDFYMENGFMGEFAKNKITEVIQHLRKEIIGNKIAKIQKERNKSAQSKQEIESLNAELKSIPNLSVQSRIECEKIISIVGEPILNNSLMELFCEAYPRSKDEFIDEQIQSLEKMKRNDRYTHQ